MARLSRISASVDAALLERFDALVEERGYPTRSKALEELMRKALYAHAWESGRRVTGAIALVYDHHRGGTVRKLLEAQHDFGGVVVCTQHVHMDHDKCLEVIIASGATGPMRDLLDRLNSIKGLETSTLMVESEASPKPATGTGGDRGART